MKKFLNNLAYVYKMSKGSTSKMVIYAILNIFRIGFNIIFPILSAKQIVYLTSNKFHQLLMIALVILGVNLVAKIISYITDAIGDKLYIEILEKVRIKVANSFLAIETKIINS